MAIRAESMMDSGAVIYSCEERPINEAMHKKVAQCIRARLDIIGVDWTSSGAEVKMLDYACGNGFLSRVFAPHVSSITAIDASPAMVKKYNARVGELGPQHASTQAIVGDLICSTPIPSTTDDSFNLITVSAALHHFPNTEDAVQRLVERLRPGGVLFIQDIFDNGHRGSEEKKPRGFTLDELRSIMSHAGLVDFRFEVLPEDLELEVRDGEVLRINCFIARGLKREQ